MDLNRHIVAVAAVVLNLVCMSSGNIVLNVQHKFADRQRSLSALKNHDSHRHRRLLASVDLPLGGNGHPSEAGLYFAKIGLGNPSKDYFVQVDTGSDLLWVNCINCDKCPRKSDLGVKLTLYDPKGSSSSSEVQCNDPFCASTLSGAVNGCSNGMPCQYTVVYGDGSQTVGYFVKDNVLLDQVTGNKQSAHTNASIVFGCGAQQSGQLGSSSEAVDGILGFGQSNSSLISQLAAAGKVKKMFAHCLNNIDGGGIFVIGEVVSPKVKTTPIVPDQPHYNIVMTMIEVGGNVLPLPLDAFSASDQSGTVIDSGTTLAYFPDMVYEALMLGIKNHQPGLKLETVEEQFSCFSFSSSVDDGFPVVNFHFENDLTLEVYPHDYLFQIKENFWCFGWQNSEMQTKDGREMTLLGDMVLSNKLVFYDLENQGIGWTEYNCSSSIKLKDEHQDATVGAHNLSSASRLMSEGIATYLLMLIASLYRLFT